MLVKDNLNVTNVPKHFVEMGFARLIDKVYVYVVIGL
jgi:hypothetical protein